MEAIIDEPWGVSDVTLAEALVTPARVGHLEEVESALVALDIHEVPLGSGAPGRLAQMRVEVGLKMPDCCVLLAAQTNEAALASFDAQLISAAEKLGIGVVCGDPGQKP